MKLTLIATLCLLHLIAFSQVEVKGKWNLQAGVSSNTWFTYGKPCVNIRYVSPRFKWSEEWNGEKEEKDPEPFKNMRIMFELMVGPCFRVICTSANAQYRLIKCRRFTTYITGGLKFLLVTKADYAIPNYRKGNGGGWYMNMGLLSQFDLGRVSPFVEIGGDRILTLGSEVRLHRIFKKTRSRYNLRKPASKN